MIPHSLHTGQVTQQIYLIRHGETIWSLSGQHTGNTDLPLTENGEQQARHLIQLLAKIKLTHILTSPMQRARRTCELAGLGNTARVETNLSEWNYGDYEGRTAADIHAERPGWKVYRDGCPNGESAEEVSQRADRVVEILRRLEGTIALFSHGQFLRALAVRWIGLPIGTGEHFGLDTGSISILGYEHHQMNAPALSLWNASPVHFLA